MGDPYRSNTNAVEIRIAPAVYGSAI